MTLNKIPAYGFQSFRDPALAYKNLFNKLPPSKQARAIKVNIAMSNVSKVLSYIPIICNLMGVITLLGFLSKSQRENVSIYHVPRALTQLTGLGIANLPADVIISIIRKCKNNTSHQNAPSTQAASQQ